MKTAFLMNRSGPRRSLPPAATALALALLLLALPARAQQSAVAPVDSTVLAAQRFDEGLAAVQGADYGQAITLLAPLVARAPGYFDYEDGAGAYWLGRAYAAQGETERMRQTWQTGLRALEAEGHFDIRLADAYLGLLLDDPDTLDAHLDQALHLYTNLLNNVDVPALQPDERARLDRHMVLLGVILPADVFAAVVEGDPAADPATWRYREGAGGRLMAWWRSQDPVAATRKNERLEEHLRRVAHVTNAYRYDGRPTGLDDRGEVYLRYGEPDETTELTFVDSELNDYLYRPGVVINLSDFPDNAFWAYGHIDRAAYFLFVEEDGYYRIGETHELIPKPLKQGLSPSSRGLQKADMLLLTLRHIYRELAMLHPDFELRYMDVADYWRELEGNRANGGSGNIQFDPPYVFADRLQLRSVTEDERATADRERYVPQQYTEALRAFEPLPMAIRTARFLEDDGTTRTEIYWSPLPGRIQPARPLRRALRRKGYEPPFDDFFIRLTAVQQTEAFYDRVVNHNSYLFADLLARGNDAIPVQTMTVRGDTGRYHLSLQWDQYLVSSDGVRKPRPGEQIKVATLRQDSLMALGADPGVLEMSDLQAIFVPNGQIPGVDPEMPYPFEAITPGLQLGLRFEVYHLTFDAEDQVHFEVAYEIVREMEEGPLKFLGRGEARTTARAQYTASQRTSRESIWLDLSEWGGSGRLVVKVNVTDTTSGQTITRSMTFELSDDQ